MHVLNVLIGRGDHRIVKRAARGMHGLFIHPGLTTVLQWAVECVGRVAAHWAQRVHTVWLTCVTFSQQL